MNDRLQIPSLTPSGIYDPIGLIKYMDTCQGLNIPSTGQNWHTAVSVEPVEGMEG